MLASCRPSVSSWSRTHCGWFAQNSWIPSKELSAKKGGAWAGGAMFPQIQEALIRKVSQP